MIKLIFLFIFLIPSKESNALSIKEMKARYKKPSEIIKIQKSPFGPKEKLGQQLFFDTRLSGSNIMSCASCHNPSFSWSDGLAKSVGHGHKKLPRKTPTILNAALGELFFWDGRSDSLEDQALKPIASPDEMNQNLDELVLELKNIPQYVKQFQSLYPKAGISSKSIADAIASFERTVISKDSPFDRYISGKSKAISKSARQGFILFNTKARCFDCHSGWNFTDQSFHDIGLKDSDIGRGKHLPKLKLMQHVFKVPTLRNVALRAPYMHNGSLKSLEEVVEFYNRGGDVKRESLSDLIFPLNLTKKEIKNLVTFLQTLTSPEKSFQVPTLPPSAPLTTKVP